ncbi:hypothetical protein LshimejAT787_1200900 [Lyophyllum shimeji]|uniref:Uncharacterized protein n=1 Tax=Lyophyllum shimeji TaxID=47721 RepID=A0A9P3UTY3_LYOSH|nr:hypothetical protein LshimejAT787_1200900 [Lyophyllum shimeji]
MISQAPAAGNHNNTSIGATELSATALCLSTTQSPAPAIITTTALPFVARDEALSSPDTTDGSEEDDDLELPKFAFKARTRKFVKHLARA